MKEIDSDLESLQHEVGGYIEAMYPDEDPVALVCNEEGKLEGLPLNRACLLYTSCCLLQRRQRQRSDAPAGSTAQ